MIKAYNFLLKLWILTFAFTLPFSVSAEEYCERGWFKSFNKYSTPEKLNAPAGFLVKSAPCDDSDTIETGVGNPEVVGHLDSNGTRYYMSRWSYAQAIKGNDPNWIRLKVYDSTDYYYSKNIARYSIEFYDNSEEIYTHYFEVKIAPKTVSETIKVVSKPTNVGVVGHVDTKDGRFYITQWSWDRALIGERPNWVYIPSISPKYSITEADITEEKEDTIIEDDSYSNEPVYTGSSIMEETENIEESDFHNNASIYTGSFVSYSSPIKQKAIVCLGQLTAKGLVKKYVKNAVVAFAIEEIIDAFVTQEISLESVATSAVASFIQNEIKSKLKEKGHSLLANAIDIGKLGFDFAACMSTD